MPDLAMPIFNCEPLTSLLGIMYFPNDFQEAGILASWHLAGALQAASNEQIAMIGPERIWAVHDMARGYPRIVKKEKKALYRGTQAGYLASYLWNAWKSGTPATQEDAIRAAEATARNKFSGVRSTFMAAKKIFRRFCIFGLHER